MRGKEESMKLLHIIATPRGKKSRTLKVSDTLLERVTKELPGAQVETLELFSADLPELNVQRVEGKYTLMSGGTLQGEVQKQVDAVQAVGKKFLEADMYLISTPMWNFGIPYKLKHYIDLIVQPGITFQYGKNGPEGLVKGKRMVVVTSRGGDYSSGPMKDFDQVGPYLKTVFGFIGIKDLVFIDAQPMDAAGEEGRNKAIAAAQEAVSKLPLGQPAQV